MDDDCDRVCMVCCRMCLGVRRELDEESFWFHDLLKERLGETYEQYQTLCSVCDKLVTEYEDISREKRSIHEELQLRFSGICVEDGQEFGNTDETDVEIGQDLGNFYEPEDVETGEITDVPDYIKNGVNIYEINVKSEADETKLSTFEPVNVISKEDTNNVIVYFNSDDENYNNETSPEQMNPINSTFSCSNCGKGFASSTKMNSHIKKCKTVGRFQCKECDKNFANGRNLRDHINIFHIDNCEEENIVPKYNFPCQECDKVFYKKSNLQSHLLRHSNEKPFICAVANCSRRFKREKTLLKHFQLIHEGVKDQFLCVHCGQQFLSSSGLRGHLSVHSGQIAVKRIIKCPDCPKMFRCQADLRAHSVVHTKVKAFSCSICSQTFSQKASLRDHENVHLKKFQCDGCGKSFGRERYLQLHVKTCVKLNKQVILKKADSKKVVNTLKPNDDQISVLAGGVAVIVGGDSQHVIQLVRQEQVIQLVKCGEQLYSQEETETSS